MLMFAAFAGCSPSALNNSPESVRDPLGIDRAVNDYYFPNGVPAGGPDSIETAQELIDPIAPSGMDTQSQLTGHGRWF